MLIGHQRPRDMFLEAIGSGRMHHAWLLTGPRGIGKRRFADWAALKLLAGHTGPGEVPAEDPAVHLVAASSHPDHRVLEPPTEGKGSATETIVVEQIRALGDFLHSFPSIARWRTMIVDSVDDMNPSAANAFLKELEEPRADSVFFLVSHSPARLLPTIRSRCRVVRLFPLPTSEVRAVLDATGPELATADLDALATLADGAPGRVATLSGADLPGLERAVARIMSGDDAAAQAVSLARSMQSQAAAPRLKALLALAPQRIASAARQRPDPRLFDLHAEAELLARDAVRLAYAPPQVALALADILARAGRIQRAQ